MNEELLHLFFTKEEGGFDKFQEAMKAPKSNNFMLGSEQQQEKMKIIKRRRPRLPELKNQPENENNPSSKVCRKLFG